MSPRPNFRGRLRPALIFELGRIGSEHLPNDLPRDPKLPADRLDRPLLNEIRPADLRNRLHDQHPELGLHVPWKPVWTLIPGVPFGCRSPRKRGPYSMPIHSPTREAATENLSACLLNHLMNMDQASGPRMPRIKKLRDPVGVPSSCCTIASERIDS